MPASDVHKRSGSDSRATATVRPQGVLQRTNSAKPAAVARRGAAVEHRPRESVDLALQSTRRLNGATAEPRQAADAGGVARVSTSRIMVKLRRLRRARGDHRRNRHSRRPRGSTVIALRPMRPGCVAMRASGIPQSDVRMAGPRTAPLTTVARLSANRNAAATTSAQMRDRRVPGRWLAGHARWPAFNAQRPTVGCTAGQAVSGGRVVNRRAKRPPGLDVGPRRSGGIVTVIVQLRAVPTSHRRRDLAPAEPYPSADALCPRSSDCDRSTSAASAPRSTQGAPPCNSAFTWSRTASSRAKSSSRR